jgi:drug/metabolite transporter (DMT)-like permease
VRGTSSSRAIGGHTGASAGAHQAAAAAPATSGSVARAMPDMVPAGIAVAAAASVAFEAGYLLQALEARSGAVARPAAGLVALLRRRRWLAGLALAGLGALLQVLALRLAPLTVVQPALALGVVGLVGIGGRLLGEPAGLGDVLAAVALASGIVLVALADVEEAAPSAAGTVVALVVLGAPLVAGLAVRSAPPWVLLAGAGGGDAVAAIAAKRLADAWDLASVGWLALAAVAVAGSLACEMAALRSWPATRVGPFVLVCQTAIPVLLAPVVAGERWGSQAPLVLAGLLVVVLACARLARSAGLLDRGEALEQDVGRGRQPVP